MDQHGASQRTRGRVHQDDNATGGVGASYGSMRGTQQQQQLVRSVLLCGWGVLVLALVLCCPTVEDAVHWLAWCRIAGL